MATAEITAALKDLFKAPIMFNPSAYSYVRSNQDGGGIFTTLTYKRRDGTKIAESVLSNQVSGNYTVETVTFFGDDGATAWRQVTWALAYNAGGDLLSRTFVEEIALP